MRERPPVQPLSIIETAVYDTNAFLAHRENRFFLKGERLNPITDSGSSELAIWGFMAGMGLVVVGIRRLLLEGGDESNIGWIRWVSSWHSLPCG